MDSEHSKNIQQDHFRLYQLEKSTSNPDHPYHKFATGDSKTLRDVPEEKGIDVRERLLAFHDLHYFPENMKLCVLGKQGIGELAQLVGGLFKDIKTRETVSKPPKSVEAYANPFDGLGARKFEVKPVKELRRIGFCWAMPPLFEHYAKAPTYYLSNLIGHEGQGSILSYLKKEGWATGLYAGASRYSNFSLFKISVECTVEGISRHWEEIISAVFTYLELLRSSGPQRWLFEEIANQEACEFRFQSDTTAVNMVSKLVGKLHHFPKKHVLTALKVFTDFDPELIQQCLDVLTPSTVQITLVDNQFSTVLKETWYKTDYNEEKLEEQKLTRWIQSGDAAEHLSLPEPNTFIPTHFDVYPFVKPVDIRMNNTSGQWHLAPMQMPSETAFTSVGLDAESELDPASEVAELLEGEVLNTEFELRQADESWAANDVWRPPLLLKRGYCDVWFKQDTTFKLPKVSIVLLFKCPHIQSSVDSAVMGKLFVAMVKDALNEFAYAAEIAGLSYSIVSALQLIEVTVGGFHDKSDVLMKKILDTLFDMSVLRTSVLTDDIFSRCKEKLLRKLDNWKHEQPYLQAIYNSSCLLNVPFWSKQEHVSALTSLTLAHLTASVQHLIKVSKVDMLAVGNWQPKDALRLSEVVSSCVEPHRMTAGSGESRVVCLVPSEEVWCVAKGESADEPNSAVEILFQIGQEVDQIAELEVLAHIASEPFFNRLRTDKQLGYIVHCGIRSDQDVYSLRFIVQSTMATPAMIDNYVEEFLLELEVLLLEMEEEEFEANVNALLANMLQKDKTIYREATRWAKQIKSQRLDFSWTFHLAQYLSQVSKADIVGFLATFVKKGSPLRKKLVVGIDNIKVACVVTDFAKPSYNAHRSFLRQQTRTTCVSPLEMANFKGTRALYGRRYG